MKKNYGGTEPDKLHTIRFEIYQNGMKMLHKKANLGMKQMPKSLHDGMKQMTNVLKQTHI